MEQVLNLLWLAASVLLGVLLFRSRGGRNALSGEYVYPHSTAWISYLILVAMLLPVISMTDDLLAMVAPTDGEQVVRRYDGFLAGHSPTPVHTAHVSLFFPVRSVSFSSVQDAGALESVQDSCAACSYSRQNTQDRAPPVAV